MTIAFADPASGFCATLRLGLAGGRTASGLALLFHDGEQVALAADSEVAVDDPSSWDAISAAGIDVTVVEPLQRWTVSFASDEASLDLEVEACGPAAELGDDDPVAALGGMQGFELPVRVRGTAVLGDLQLAIDALGQRSRSWGSPDWSKISRTRLVQGWFDGGTISLAAISPQGRAHGEEAVSAAILGPHGAATVDDARISTTFDDQDRQRRVALELWVGEDEDRRPRYLSGEVFCGTTLDLGRLRLDSAFVHWRFDGMAGIGRYDILRRSDAA